MKYVIFKTKNQTSLFLEAFEKFIAEDQRMEGKMIKCTGRINDPNLTNVERLYMMLYKDFVNCVEPDFATVGPILRVSECNKMYAVLQSQDGKQTPIGSMCSATAERCYASDTYVLREDMGARWVPAHRNPDNSYKSTQKELETA